MIPVLEQIAAEMIAQLDEAARMRDGRITVDPQSILSRDLSLSPPGLWSPNRHCRLIEARDGWIAVNLAREDDRASVAAWLEDDVNVEPWDAVTRTVPLRDTADLLERAKMLHLPVSVVGEISKASDPTLRPSKFSKVHSRLTVVDMSSLWAGPLCGALLAEAGLSVTKVESVSRPDSTQHSSPVHDQRLNGRKRRVSLDFTQTDALCAIIDQADVLITSARPHALARLGLSPERVFERNPDLLWIAITAYGFTGENSLRVGFGDDCAAAGGLINWRGAEPSFIGDALADPLTGMAAALAAMRALARRECGLLGVDLASTAALVARQAGLRP